MLHGVLVNSSNFKLQSMRSYHKKMRHLNKCTFKRQSYHDLKIFKKSNGLVLCDYIRYYLPCSFWNAWEIGIKYITDLLHILEGVEKHEYGK